MFLLLLALDYVVLCCVVLCFTSGFGAAFVFGFWDKQ